MRVRFLKWFNKHPSLYGDCFSIVGTAFLFGMFNEVLLGDYWRQLILLLWLNVFMLPGHVSLERFLVDAAKALEE